MKKLWIVLILFVFAFQGRAQQNLQNLSFNDAKYFYFRQPGSLNGININVLIKIPGVDLVTTNNIAIQRLNANQNFNAGQGQPVYVLAIPMLYQTFRNGNTNVYRFGVNGGEGNFNSAEVSVTRTTNDASPITINSQNYIRPPVKFSIDLASLYSEPSSGTYNNQSYLRVEASDAQKAIVQINRQSERGNAFVCIFTENGNLIAELDPKKPNDNSPAQSFTVDQTVYIIPVIGKKVSSQNGVDLVVFEVGDPKQNVTVEATEE